tara:strand:+ start:1884 stop:2135 length:252 start_codon:yes stop_codon:yes gene_type:complete
LTRVSGAGAVGSRRVAGGSANADVNGRRRVTAWYDRPAEQLVEGGHAGGGVSDIKGDGVCTRGYSVRPAAPGVMAFRAIVRAG